jgi:hypothetical protein
MRRRAPRIIAACLTAAMAMGNAPAIRSALRFLAFDGPSASAAGQANAPASVIAVTRARRLVAIEARERRGNDALASSPASPLVAFPPRNAVATLVHAPDDPLAPESVLGRAPPL